MSDLKAPAGRVAGTPAKAKPPDPPAAPGVVIRNGRLVAGSALAELRAREQVALDRERELRDGTPVGRPLIASGQALVGAVQRIDLTDEAQVRRIAKQAQEWQVLAWAYFDVLGPIKYAMRFLSNSLLRVRLFAAVTDPDNPDAPPIPVHEAARPGEPVDGEARPALLSDAMADQAAAAVARLKVADGGQGQLLADCGICLSVPGEAWMLTEVNADGEEEISVRSDRELGVKGDRVTVRDTPNDKEGRELGGDDDLLRLWRRHPAWRGLADSNMRAVLDDCAEFLVLRRMFASMGKSRLNAGILVVPSEASFGRAQVVTPEGVATPNTTKDPFDVQLANYLVMPVGDEASPANVAPGIVRVKGEYVKDVHWMDIGRKITDAELKRAGDLVTSIAQGLDLPIEVLTGMAASNHWSAWLIDDSLYRSHIYPLLALIAAQLTSGMVRPWLRAVGWDAADAARIVVGINASDLVADPDRSKTADEAHDRLTISDATHRRDKGYGDDDAPDEDELARRMDAKRPAPPFGGGERTEEGPPEEEEPEPEEDPVVGAGRRRNGRGSVGARLGELDRGLMARLSAAAETAMDRALDRAGARLRNLAKKDHVASAALTAAGAVDNPLVASVVGEQRTAVLVAAASEDLLDGAFDQLEQRFDTWVRRTQAQARTVVGRVGASDADLADLEAEQDEDRTAAWAWLAASMAALARARMFDPNPDVAPLGEVDASVRVPPALMRNALARAGGATPVETATGGVVDVLAGQPVGGVATGDLVRKAFASVGLPWTGYVWDYGDPGARSRPFPPHEELDQVAFSRWDSEELANTTGDYPHNDYFRPGDHRGCGCGWHPEVPDGSAGEPEGGTVSDEATEE